MSSKKGKKKIEIDDDEDDFNELVNEDGEDEYQSSQEKASNKKRKRPLPSSQKVDENSDVVDGPDTTQSSQRSGISDQEKEKLVGDLMRYILFLDRQKLPLRKDDIASKITKDYKGKDLTNSILKTAQEKFKTIFGFDLIEVPKITKPRGSDRRAARNVTSKSENSKIYVLKNIIHDKALNIVNTEDKEPKMGLVMLILALIFVNNNSLPEDIMWHLLSTLGISKEDKTHPHFGDVQNYIEHTLTKELYLVRQKMSNQNNTVPSYEFIVGPRALVEVDKPNILKFISMMYGEEIDELHQKEIEADDEVDDDNDND